jgi:hypothetical protein
MDDLVKRTTAAIDVLKGAIGDTYSMISIENKYGRGSTKGGDDDRRKVLCGLALDILTGERPV